MGDMGEGDHFAAAEDFPRFERDDDGDEKQIAGEESKEWRMPRCCVGWFPSNDQPSSKVFAFKEGRKVSRDRSFTQCSADNHLRGRPC